jgi:hypothetical protein
MPYQESIVARDVADQLLLRPPRPASDLDEFLEFLGRIEDLFGPTEPSRCPTTGEHFRL